ncbi:MAG: NADP-dependent malic enzyme [Candidatus Pacearchaeota archaeon]
MNIKKESLKLHEKLRGKLIIKSKVKLKTKKNFSLAYTPGVAEPCKKIYINKNDVYKYTIKSNSVAVISNGTAVLGLGDIGAFAAIPVMEGKCAIFKELAGIDAFPICIDSKDIEENVKIIKKISPVFGGINLEDYKAPECFEIEKRLQNIGIPVMHDDQHGTAIVVLAALINSLKLVNKKISEIKIAIIGAGAAGTAVAKLLYRYGAKNIILCDIKGIISKNRKDLDKYKKELLKISNKENIDGGIKEAIQGRDVLIGLSKGNIVTKEMIKKMNKKAIVFAMANPIPEIFPKDAKEAGAYIIATGRSDFPNQINNALAFPGVFRGALDVRAKKITDKMKIAAAEALANMIKPEINKILPSIKDRDVVKIVAQAVKKVAK